ncbi:MAG: hypothetical protein H6708_03260 [Kofleriaceae bacterium]|nr:hypothetical protein [Myxococcales bacterium]MCB9559411.1 hypothetical protein [Kofleriaceae bacterium]
MSTTESRFVELVRSWLVSLPHDLKIAFEAMDDENLPREGRELATGAVIYVVSPNDFVSDRNEAVSSYVDDVILLRLALLELVTSGDEDAAALRDRFPSLFDGLEDDLQLCREMMGDLMAWLDGKVAGLRTTPYKGKTPKVFLDDDEAREKLFEDGLVFRTDYPVDDDTVQDKLKKASTVTDVMRRRMAEEARVG